MIRPLRLSIAICVGVSLASVSGADASHGHGGGGGHMGGGGHIGGGHMGGGHMGMGHFGGGSHGGAGGHIGSGHFGGAPIGGFNGGSHIQHFGGGQNFGGAQHIGGMQHNTFHSGAIHNGMTHSNSLGSQHILHNGVQQHLGNSATHHQLNAPFYQNHGSHQLVNNAGQHHGNSAMLNSQHHGSQFLQNHGTHSANRAHTTSLASFSSGSQHHGSQFLRNHGGQSTGLLHHNGLQGGGQRSSLNVGGAHTGNSSFLANHHHVANGNLGNHHNGLGNGVGTHHQSNGLRNGGANHVGTHVHNSLVQNYHYRHHGGGIGGGGYGYRHYGGGGYRWGGYGYRGYGYGFYPGYYGFGFGLGRFAYGWGWGWGLGYGLYGGYPRWGCFAYQPVCCYQPYYLGYGGYGYGGYGYDGYGYGYGGYSPYGAYASLSPLAGGYGYSPTAVVAATPAIGLTDPTNGSAQAISTQLASSDPKSVVAALPTAEQFAQIGETAFKARDYKGAVRAWRHGLIDDPNNGVLVLMLAQALFATEQFNESAGATQFAMQLLPKEQWETVVKNYRELYGKVDDYTTQLRALEKAARAKTDDPALRFLLGYHYGFLGYAKEATQQLEKCVSLAAEDETAQKLLDLFNEKLPKDPNKKEEAPAPAKPPAPGASPDLTLPPLIPAPVPPAPKTAEEPKKADGE